MRTVLICLFVISAVSAGCDRRSRSTDINSSYSWEVEYDEGGHLRALQLSKNGDNYWILITPRDDGQIWAKLPSEKGNYFLSLDLKMQRGSEINDHNISVWDTSTGSIIDQKRGTNWVVDGKTFEIVPAPTNIVDAEVEK